MTTQQVDLLSTMVESGARAVAEATGSQIHVGQIVSVPANEAVGAPGMMINRSQLSVGSNSGTLLTIVPASGLVASNAALDAIKLTEALVTGAVAGIATAGGPLLQALPAQLIPSASSVDPTGSEAFAFDLVVESRSLTVLWVVEATLGALLASSIPVDEPAVEGPSVAPAALPDLGRAGGVAANRDIRTLSDVTTRLSVEIARGTAKVEELVSMTRGSVFELDREAGDPVDILVNGATVARGDIVVVGNQLGVRLTEVCEPAS